MRSLSFRIMIKIYHISETNCVICNLALFDDVIKNMTSLDYQSPDLRTFIPGIPGPEIKC